MTFEQWKEDYALVYEPNYSKATEADCLAAWKAGQEEMQQQLAAEQAYSARLRSLLEHIMHCIPYGGFAQIHYGSATHADIDYAVALPYDDSVLREWGARLLEKLAAKSYTPGSNMHDDLLISAEKLRSGDWKPCS